MQLTRRQMTVAAVSLVPAAVISRVTGKQPTPTTATPNTATPNIEGPLQGGLHGWPFACPVQNVTKYGYVMDEFIVEGIAKSYRIVPGSKALPDGRWSTEEDASAPYRTRVYVVRPAAVKDFNGVAVVN